ncbi:MAG: hypothetical protein NTW87_19985 [Planctomycetota bacterium]|nr:hypothetical protein [Planctomycetota bacterium]
MSLLDIWDYIRASGDRRLRQQGYLRGGVGIIERYRRTAKFWEPHLENNRRALREIAAQIAGAAPMANPQSAIPTPQSGGGTLVILGAGRLLDVPWQELFPLFARVVLADADSAFVPYVERLLSTARANAMPKPIFDIGDVTGSVVDLAAWAEHTIAAAASPASAADALADGCNRAGAAQAPWARTYVDVRLVVSSNLLSQLGHFPRLHIQTLFRRRFGKPFSEHERAAESLERYFDRVRARHIADVASFGKAWAYLATDVETLVYTLSAQPGASLLAGEAPPNAGVELDEKGGVRFAWPAEIEERDDPLHGQRVEDLWPRGTVLDPPRRWAWHVVPQGSEKKYRDRGRVHVVEAWVKRPG